MEILYTIRVCICFELRIHFFFPSMKINKIICTPWSPWHSCRWSMCCSDSSSRGSISGQDWDSWCWGCCRFTIFSWLLLCFWWWECWWSKVLQRISARAVLLHLLAASCSGRQAVIKSTTGSLTAKFRLLAKTSQESVLWEVLHPFVLNVLCCFLVILVPAVLLLLVCEQEEKYSNFTGLGG